MSMIFKDYELREPALDAEIVIAEKKLGIKLPEDYKILIKNHNGGYIERKSVKVEFPTIWGQEGIELDYLYGVGETDGIDSETGSKYLIDEWDYPDIGVVILMTTAGGYDTFMLDYSNPKKEEPPVVYVDDNREVHKISENFADFLRRIE